LTARARTATALALVVALAAAAAASAQAEPYVAIKGAPGPGPARYDKVFVQKFGPADARRVLILVPGYVGGAGDFTLVARDIVARVPNLQVWAYDRRSQAFEDRSLFRSGDPTEAFDYYLRFRTIRGKRFLPVSGPTVTYVRRWGLKLALEDLRHVTRRARAGGRKVILGGHSLGASTALAYASWDFKGRAGYRDLAGLVLIDGGLMGTFAHPKLATVKRRLRELRRTDPFVDLLNIGYPWAPGVFVESASLFALKQPAEPSVFQEFPLLPVEFKPPVRVTNEAILGYAFDQTTSPAALALIHVRAGGLAATGDPRPWQNGEVTPIERLAQTFAQEPANGVEWYFPKRLTLDVDGVDALRRNAITRLLGLRPWHRREVKLPLYAYETDLTGGRVLRGVRRFMRGSRVRKATLVADHATSHLDPLTAAPQTNSFLQSVVPFLRAPGRRPTSTP
jgi:pimeloyl-ACP methyl ester carboxylesterase